MRRKQPWMFIGATVLAQGNKAEIKAMQENNENNLDGVDYVYYIDCVVEGENQSGRYHPSDIEEFK